MRLTNRFRSYAPLALAAAVAGTGHAQFTWIGPSGESWGSFRAPPTRPRFCSAGPDISRPRARSTRPAPRGVAKSSPVPTATATPSGSPQSAAPSAWRTPAIAPSMPASAQAGTVPKGTDPG